MKTFFNLALSGLSEADAKKAIETLDAPQLGQWSLSEGAHSDLLIIDVDSVWGHMDWLKAMGEDRRCAAYTDQDSMRDSELLLRKPLDPQALTDMLLSIQRGTAPAAARSEHATTADAGTPETRPRAATPPPAPVREAPAPVPAAAPEAPPARPAAQKPAAAKTAAAKPETAPQAPDATVGALLLGSAISASVLVESGESDVQLFIDPVGNTYRAPPQLKPIGKLLALPAARMRPIGPDAPEVQHAGPEQPIVRLLWFAALQASKGALAPHLDAGSVWKLTRWPQIEREFPRHFRIATALMKQAGTLEEVAEASKSPVEDVADFINAYHLAGYVAAEGSDEPVEAANSTANVLARLRRSFSR